MTNMITDNKEQVRDKTVLLFSGGMDSLMINHIKQPDVLLNISMNSNYDRTERATFDSIGIDESKLINMDGVIDLGRFERDDAIIPNRNAHLILLASHYGETILLGSVSGDRSYDKDERFYFHMENLLNHMWEDNIGLKKESLRFILLSKTEQRLILQKNIFKKMERKFTY